MAKMYNGLIRQIVAAGKYNRVVQMGSQSRSSPALQRPQRCAKRLVISTWLAVVFQMKHFSEPVEPVPLGRL
jgi:hypothetical protein